MMVHYFKISIKTQLLPLPLAASLPLGLLAVPPHEAAKLFTSVAETHYLLNCNLLLLILLQLEIDLFHNFSGVVATHPFGKELDELLEAELSAPFAIEDDLEIVNYAFLEG